MDPDPDSDPDPAIFAIDHQVADKNKFKKFFSAYYCPFSKIKSQKRGHKTVGIKVFLTIFA
jgi:hypothetical protein